MLDSLLGPAFEPALRRVVLLMLPPPASTTFAGRERLSKALSGCFDSVGVGGVLTISGVGGSSGDGLGCLGGSNFVRTDSGLGVSGLLSSVSLASFGSFLGRNTSRKRELEDERLISRRGESSVVRLRSTAGTERISGPSGMDGNRESC